MKPILAIDFGTTNTYLSISKENGMKELTVFDTSSEEMHGLTSAILYYNAGEKKGTIQIGQQAIDMYAPSSPAKIEKNGLQLAASFKPRLHTSISAQKDAENFLKELYRNLKSSKKLPHDPSDMDVIFGIPCEADRNYQDKLKMIAKNAGFGNIRLLHEPFGGLWYDLDLMGCSQEDFLKKRVLVVDFGGGTCDFTLLQDGKILRSWGDMHLGGCLFDDLFYQWLFDLTNHDSRLINRDYFWLFIQSRKLKERFSRWMKNNKSATFEEYALDTYEIELTWNEFERRVQNYVPSSAFLKYYNNSEGSMQQHFKKNLLQWFQNSLMEGFEKDYPLSSVDLVILAGGSSLWYFVTDFCRQKFGESKIRCCSNVFAAISVGLGHYVMLKNEAEIRVEEILAQKDGFIKDFLEKVQQCLIPGEGLFRWKQNEIIKRFGTDLFQNVIEPELKKFQQNGGSIQELENRIVENVNTRKTLLQKYIHDLFVQKSGEINQLLQNELSRLFNIPAAKLNIASDSIQLENFYKSDENFETDLEDVFGIITAGIISTILIAIIIASPTIGGLPAWLIAVLIALCGGKLTAKALKPVKWSPGWASWLMNNEKVQHLCDDKFLPKFQEQFEKLFADMVKKKQKEIEDEITRIIDEEIEKYITIIGMEPKG